MEKILFYLLLGVQLPSAFAFEAPRRVVVREERKVEVANGLERIPRIVAAPIFFHQDFMKHLQKNSAGDSFYKSLEDNADILTGYAALAYGTHKLNNAYFAIDEDDFNRVTKKEMIPDPKKVLYVDLLGKGDGVSWYSNVDFENKYGKHPDAQMITADSLDELKKKLLALPQDGSFDRIEILAHGEPGAFQIAGGDVVGANTASKMKAWGLKIATPGAEVRMMSCSLGGDDFLTPRGEKFLSNFGSSLLPEGGKIFAATRNIRVQKIDPLRVFTHSIGFGVVIDILHDMLPNINRNFKTSRMPFRKVEVPAPGCGARFAGVN